MSDNAQLLYMWEKILARKKTELEKLYVITGMDQPTVGVCPVEVESMGARQYKIGCVNDVHDCALPVIGQPGPLGPEEIDPYVDYRQDLECVTPWPERTIFVDKRRALIHALAVVNVKINCLAHFHEFWYTFGAKVPQEYVDDMDQLVEGEVESYRVSLHASKTILEVQLAEI